MVLYFLAFFFYLFQESLIKSLSLDKGGIYFLDGLDKVFYSFGQKACYITAFVEQLVRVWTGKIVSSLSVFVLRFDNNTPDYLQVPVDTAAGRIYSPDLQYLICRLDDYLRRRIAEVCSYVGPLSLVAGLVNFPAELSSLLNTQLFYRAV